MCSALKDEASSPTPSANGTYDSPSTEIIAVCIQRAHVEGKLIPKAGACVAYRLQCYSVVLQCSATV